MAKHEPLSVETLRHEVADGRIDTVAVSITAMQGLSLIHI